MQSPSLNACADYETKILPRSQPSCQTLWQTSLTTNKQSHRNFFIVITTNIFDSGLELERSKVCRRSHIFARNTECFQSGPANLASCKKLHRFERLILRLMSKINASRRLNRGRDREAASLSP